MHGRGHERADDLKGYLAVEKSGNAQLQSIRPSYMEGARDRSPEALNDLHAAAAAWTRGSLVVGLVRRIRIIVLIRAPIRWRRGHIEQLSA